MHCDELQESTQEVLNGVTGALPILEAVVAKAIYGLSRTEVELILRLFPKITAEEQELILEAYDRLGTKLSHQAIVIARPQKGQSERVSAGSSQSMDEAAVRIPNHLSARLSDRDLQMIVHVPPGGNWKNIPESIPSKRLEQIRKEL